MNREEYWDKRALSHFALSEQGNIISFRDNFIKRKEILRRILKYDLQSKVVLEIGCGFGTILASLKICTGIQKCKATDVSQIFCDVASDLFQLKVHKAYAKDLPFQDDEFDYILMFDVLEHIDPEEREKSYAEIDRVLRSQGKIFINNPLSESQHDEKFDFGFSEKDIYQFKKKVSLRIENIEEYSIISNGHLLSYQWIILKR